MKDEIRNLERDSFAYLKEQENINRDDLRSDDILYISDYTLEKYNHSGDSGSLYLATNKHNPNEKYILKHEYYDCACNEYMYSKIGNKMGIKIAPVKLFIIDNKRNKFKSDFVCGIKYFENGKKIYFNELINMKEEIDNWEDYLKFRGMEKLLSEGDDIEVIEYQNSIYRIDTTDAFNLNTDNIKLLAYDYNNEEYGVNLREFACKEIIRLAERNTEKRIWSWNLEKDYFIKYYGEQYLNYFLDPFIKIKTISNRDIKKWIDILTIIYPNIVGEYYINYINNLKLDVLEFLSQVQEKELVAN